MQDKNNVVDYSKALPITIRGLTKQYGSLYALNSIDLDVSSGEFLTLLGPSGSGKTTLLMAIAGFNRPDSGSIRFGKTEMILAPPHKRGVGMVFQCMFNVIWKDFQCVFNNIWIAFQLMSNGCSMDIERIFN